MGYSFQDHTNVPAGKIDYTFGFVGREDLEYLRDSDITVEIDGVSYTDFSITGPGSLELTGTAPEGGELVRIRREMPDTEPYSDFGTGNAFSQKNVNYTNLQQLYLVHQELDGFKDDSYYEKQDLNLGGYKFENVGTGVVDTDGVNLLQVQNLISSADLVVAQTYEELLTEDKTIFELPFEIPSYPVTSTLYANGLLQYDAFPCDAAGDPTTGNTTFVNAGLSLSSGTDVKIFSYTHNGLPDINEIVDSIRSFSTVEAMKAGNLIVGTTYRTTGYYSEGDGGAATYMVKEGNSSDGFADHLNVAGVTCFMVREAVMNVKQVGAYGDGVEDDTLALQYALDAGNDNILLPTGDYKISSTLTMVEGQELSGYTARLFNTDTHITLIDASAGGVVIRGLEMEGAGNSSMALAGIAISCEGTHNGTGVSPTLVRGHRLYDVHIHDIGGYGSLMHYCEDGFINEGCKFIEIGYAAIANLSVARCNVSGCHIKSVTPGTGSLAYGVFYSSASTSSGDLVGDPVSVDCTCEGVTIEDIPIWEALDTHGGHNIKFIGNTTRNCKVGILLSKIDDIFNATVKSCSNCVATGNTLEGNNNGVGIILSGDTGINCENNVISNNNINNHGADGDANTGGITVKFSDKTTMTGNNVVNCSPYGIAVINECNGFTISSNVIQDAYSASNASAAGIAIRSENNTGIIANNVLLRTNTGLSTYVMNRGIYTATASGNVVDIGLNVNEAVTPYSLQAEISGRNSPRILSGTGTVTLSTSSSTAQIAVTFEREFQYGVPAISLTADRALLGAGIGVHYNSETVNGFVIILTALDGGNFQGAALLEVKWIAAGY